MSSTAPSTKKVNIDDLAPLKARLESLEQHCLTNLLKGLEAMHEGDLTVEVLPHTEPLSPSGDADIDAFGDIFNAMLAKAQSGLELYNMVREDLREKLGDHSTLGVL